MSELVQRVEDELNDNSLVLPVICLSDSHGNFRNDIASTYKANRGKRPLLYKALREWVFETYPAWSADAEGTTHCIRPRLEADDILGILGTSPRNLGNCVIYSEDKDLKQIPGLHIFAHAPGAAPALRLLFHPDDITVALDGIIGERILTLLARRGDNADMSAAGELGQFRAR